MLFIIKILIWRKDILVSTLNRVYSFFSTNELLILIQLISFKIILSK